MGELSAAWGRQIVLFMEGGDDSSIHVVYAQEAVTGWLSFHEKPTVAEFNDVKCVCVPIARWMMVKALAADTVTPFRIVARGKKIIEKAFMPHTGLKYAVRNIDGMPQVMIPIADFDEFNGKPKRTK